MRALPNRWKEGERRGTRSPPQPPKGNSPSRRPQPIPQARQSRPEAPPPKKVREKTRAGRGVESRRGSLRRPGRSPARPAPAGARRHRPLAEPSSGLGAAIRPQNGQLPARAPRTLRAGPGPPPNVAAGSRGMGRPGDRHPSSRGRSPRARSVGQSLGPEAGDLTPPDVATVCLGEI